MPPAPRVVDLVQLFDRLASLPRTGWLLRGVTDVESVAEHSFGVVLVTSLLVDRLREDGVSVDGERALRMAVVHDLAEAFTGDIPMPAKSDDLDAALARAEEALLQEALTEAQLALWREAERGDSLEARIVKAADKIQMLAKALTYEQQRRGHLDELWTNPKNRRHMDLDAARELLDEILTRAAAARRA